MNKQRMKAVVAVAAIGFSSVHPVQSEVVFQDGFDSPTAALQNDINTNYVVRQAAGATNSTYSKTGSPASQAVLQKNANTFSSDVLLGRTRPNTNAQFIAIDLDTDFGPNVAGRQWSLSYKGKVASSVVYDGWTSFAVGNPANGPNGAQNGFGFYIRGSSGGYVAWNKGAVVGSGGIGAINGKIYTLTANFDEGAGTVEITYDSATTNINLGTFTTDFTDSIRYVEVENFVQPNTNFDGTGLVDMRWDDLTIQTTGSVPPPEIGLITINQLDGTNGLSLTWLTTNGFNYAIQSKSDLVLDNWTNDTSGIIGIDGIVTVTTAVDKAQSFYRVIVE